MTLYARQNGCCCWCGHGMSLFGEHQFDRVTIEHLDPRYSKWRGKSPGEERTALACYLCNQICKVVDAEFIQGSKRRRMHPDQYTTYARAGGQR